jgi:site-specific recombinase XerD
MERGETMTTTAIAVTAKVANGTDLEVARLVERAADYAAAAKASNTLRAYAADWRTFTAWCAARGLEARPAVPRTVAAYIASMADEGRRVPTIERAIVSISQAHRVAGLETPTKHPAVAEVRSGIRHRLGVAQRRVAPLVVSELRAAVKALGDSLLGVRNRALLVLGFAAALRRSELVALDVGDLEFTTDGLVVHIRRSKTDGEGEGAKIGVPYGSHSATCPVRTVRGWLEATGLTTGALYRDIGRAQVLGKDRLSDRQVANVVKAAARAAGLDAARFSGHSLRAGLATTAALAGKSERVIMKQTRHRSERMVRRYVREAELFNENAASGIGL